MDAGDIPRGANKAVWRPRDMCERLLTVGDVAEMCQVHRKTVMRAIRSGRLRAARLGDRGAYRLRPDDVAQWVAECVVAPVAASPRTRRPGVLLVDAQDERSA